MMPYVFFITYFLVTGVPAAEVTTEAYHRNSSTPIMRFMECLEEATNIRRSFLEDVADGKSIFYDMRIECHEKGKM